MKILGYYENESEDERFDSYSVNSAISDNDDSNNIVFSSKVAEYQNQTEESMDKKFLTKKSLSGFHLRKNPIWKKIRYSIYSLTIKMFLCFI